MHQRTAVFERDRDWIRSLSTESHFLSQKVDLFEEGKCNFTFDFFHFISFKFKLLIEPEVTYSTSWRLSRLPTTLRKVTVSLNLYRYIMF